MLLLFSYLSIHGQVFTLQKQHHDFGEIANLDFPPAVFEFKNTGKKPLAILMIQIIEKSGYQMIVGAMIALQQSSWLMSH